MSRLLPAAALLAALTLAGCGNGPLELGPFAGVRALSIDDTGTVLGDLRDPITRCRTPEGATQCAGTPFVWRNAETTFLGTLGGSWTHSVRIGAAGHVVGAGETANGRQHAFLWTRQSGMQDLGTPGGDWGYAVAVNPSGTVLVTGADGSGDLQAFLWTAGNTTGLGDLGAGRVEAMDLNASGEVVGRARHPDGTMHAFHWSDGLMTDLGATVGSIDASSIALAITDAGLIVGTLVEPNGETRAVTWQNGPTLLPTLGPAATTALDVAESGTVVGHAFDVAGARRLVVWMPDLVLLEPFDDDALEFGAIGFDGSVVGWERGAERDPARGFLWNGEEVIDLGNLGGRFTRAHAINRSGVIVGETQIETGDIRAFRWTAGTMELVGPN